MCEKNRIVDNKQEEWVNVEKMTTNMEQIYESTKQCKEIVCALEDAFVEISKIVKTLTSMSAQTNQLAQETVFAMEEKEERRREL